MTVNQALFWAWLGGAVAFALRAFDSPEFRTNMRRTQHMADTGKRSGMKWTWVAMTSIYILAPVVALLWPMFLLVRMTIGDWLHRTFVGRKYESVKVHCSVCGLVEEASVPKNAVAWTSIPNDWLINSQLELTCSPNCAKHLDHCPAHSQPNIELH